jgi:antitoxin PrlF
MPTATVTSKGQVTIPKEVRDEARIRPGYRLDFQVQKDGNILVTPKRRDLLSLIGIAHVKRKKPVTVEEMDRAMAKAISQRARR